MTVIDSEAVRKDIRQFILDTFLFGDDSGSFSDTDSFMQKGIIDSTGVLELTSFLEEKYEFQVEDEELVPTNLDSVDNLVAFVCRKKG
jgi:acyl carrier protein